VSSDASNGVSLFGASSLDSLWKFFGEMVEQIEVSTMDYVIDVLDECEEASL
jgi:hypothetical protein